MRGQQFTKMSNFALIIGGHVVDVLFDSENGKVSGIVVPGEKKMFRKNEEIFIPLEKVRKIGDDVVLIRYDFQGYNIANSYGYNMKMQNTYNQRRTNYDNKRIISQSQSNNTSFIRYRPLSNNKYK